MAATAQRNRAFRVDTSLFRSSPPLPWRELSASGGSIPARARTRRSQRWLSRPARRSPSSAAAMTLNRAASASWPRSWESRRGSPSSSGAGVSSPAPMRTQTPSSSRLTGTSRSAWFPSRAWRLGAPLSQAAPGVHGNSCATKRTASSTGPRKMGRLWPGDSSPGSGRSASREASTGGRGGSESPQRARLQPQR